jgi:EpsI family protein
VEKGKEYIILQDDERRTIQVNRLIFQKNDVRQIVLYWYQSAGRIVQSEYAQRIYLVLDALFFNRTDGALVRVSAPLNGPLDELVEDQKGFIGMMYPYLKRSFAEM